MSDFDKSEAEDREYFNLLYPNYSKDYSVDGYAWWDVSGYTVSPDIFDDISKPYVAELKKRWLKHDQWNTVMLQVDKYENLMNYTKRSGIQTFYICFYEDRSIIFNISKIDTTQLKKQEWDLPVNTVIETGNKKKSVYLLPLSNGKVLKKGWKEMDKELGR